jgi:hypothetical protein
MMAALSSTLHSARNKMKNWFAGRRGAYFFLLLGIGLMMVYVALERNFPDAGQLQTATGRVALLHPAQGGLYFALAGEPRQFVVYVKGDSDGRLRQAIGDAEAGSYPLTVLLHPGQSASPGFLQGRYYTVYGVSVGGKDVSSLAAVQGSYRRDNLIALVLGLLFAAYGGRLVYNLRNAAEPAPAPQYRRKR